MEPRCSLRWAPVTVLGVVFIAAAALLLLVDAGRLSSRMPTQVPPRAFALLPLAVGLLLLLLGLAYSA
jgi:hypothetical protein